jgi:hypothetical protein
LQHVGEMNCHAAPAFMFAVGLLKLQLALFVFIIGFILMMRDIFTIIRGGF